MWIYFEQSESKYWQTVYISCNSVVWYFEKTKGKFVISYTSPNVILGPYRAVLKQLSKVPGNGFGFAFLLSVIGPDISHHPLSQSDTRLKPITTQSIWFSRHFSVYICSPWPLWLLVLVLLAGVIIYIRYILICRNVIYGKYMLYLSSNLFAVEKETILKLKKINLFKLEKLWKRKSSNYKWF